VVHNVCVNFIVINTLYLKKNKKIPPCPGLHNPALYKLSLGYVIFWTGKQIKYDLKEHVTHALMETNVLHGFLLKQKFVIVDILVLYVTAGTTGLLIWSVTLIGLLAGGALLVYNTSALAI